MKQHTVIAITLFIFLAGLAVRGASDPDLWWHLATGRLIADNLADGQTLADAIPHQDPFSYTFNGQPWVAHEWLTDVLMYQVYQVAGLGGLMVLFGLVIGVAYWLMYWVIVDVDPVIAAAITLFACAVSIPAWGPRPQMFNLLFAAVFLAILIRWLRVGDKSVFALPLVMLFWVNMHGGFVIGLALVAVVGVQYWFSHLGGTRDGWEQLIGAGVLTAAAALANPHSFAIYIYPFQTLASDVMQNNILEWFSPNFHLVDYQLFALLILAGLVSFVYTPVKPHPGEWLLFCGAAAAGLMSVRNIPLFALVAIPTITPYLARLFARKQSAILISPIRAGVMVALALALAGWHGANVLRANKNQEADRFPVAAVNYLESIGVDGPLFNDYQFGGYLIWRGWPVYIDGRADLYGDHLLEYLAVSNARGDGYQMTIDHYNIDSALVYADSPLATVLRARGWLQVYRDDQALVLLRTAR